MLVATSTGEKPFRTVNKEYGVERVQAIESQNYFTQGTAKYLTTEFDLNQSINHQQKLATVKQIMREILQTNPEDKAAHFYLQRCDRSQVDGGIKDGE